MHMVKTTINPDDKIYAGIVKESIEKYGNTKNISRIINQHLKNKNFDTEKYRKRIAFKVREDLAILDADKEIKKGWKVRNK